MVQPRLRPEAALEIKLQEALNLANSLEEQRDGYFETEFCKKDLPQHVVVQNPAACKSLNAGTYFGKGTVDNIKCCLNALESGSGADVVFVNAILSAVQQRNLERAWGKPVLDRVGLIIGIFNAHAYTKEAKLQAQLASLVYQRSRLVRILRKKGSKKVERTFGADGESEVVSARGRGSSGQGFIGGAGETELQLQRRRLSEQKSRLLSRIAEVRHTRTLHRDSRKRHGGTNGEPLATVAVVGYTNAGKSTLVSALSDTYVYSDDRLFATVDPKLRSVALPSGKKVLLSDTVGFISDLPVQLVEAFHATLEEVVEADLLVHVLDSSAPNLAEQRATVLQVLEQIGVSKEKIDDMIEIWNKVDLEREREDDGEHLEEDHGENEDSSFSGAEDTCTGSDISSQEHVNDDNDNDIMSVGGEDGEGGTMDMQPSAGSDGCLSPGDGEENTDDQRASWAADGSCSNKAGGMIERAGSSQIECTAHLKTSAVTGLGLQELLQLIDEKLKKDDNLLQRGVFDRKWRPARAADDGIAIDE